MICYIAYYGPNALPFKKVHFVMHSLTSPLFSKKVEIFTSAEAFRYIMFLCIIFLANSFVGEIIGRIVYLL